MTRSRNRQRRGPAGFTPLLLLGLAGCSLIIPLDDYMGGIPPQKTGGSAGQPTAGVGGTAADGGSAGNLGGTAGQGTAGGNAGTGGSGAKGGRGGQGGSGASGGSDAGAPEAGAESIGGMAGEGMSGQAGNDEQAGSGGDGMGGMSAAGGRGGAGGASAAGGLAGMSGTGGCPGIDLQTDHDNCGSCGNICMGNAECLQGHCAASPCDGLCATFTSIALSSEGYKKDGIGVDDICYEVTGYAPASPNAARFIAWEFASDRTLQVNAVTVAPALSPGCALNKIPPRMGGYCVHAGAGLNSYAGVQFPLGLAAGGVSCGP